MGKYNYANYENPGALLRRLEEAEELIVKQGKQLDYYKHRVGRLNEELMDVLKSIRTISNECNRADALIKRDKS